MPDGSLRYYLPIDPRRLIRVLLGPNMSSEHRSGLISCLDALKVPHEPANVSLAPQ